MSKFANVAIKCDNYEQIKHLAELARKEGLKVIDIMDVNSWYFRYSQSCGHYSNWTRDGGIHTITYAQFIAEYEPTYTHDEYMRNVVHSMD
jgi:hypothetical protein